MAQAIVKKVIDTPEGIAVQLSTMDTKQTYFCTYSGKLTIEQLKKLEGKQIAFHEDNKNISSITKGWDIFNRPVYCDDQFHAFDRGIDD